MPRGHNSKRRQKQKQAKGNKQVAEVAQEAVAPSAEAVAAVEAAAAAASGGEEQKKKMESSFSQSLSGAASCSPRLTHQSKSPSTDGLSASGSSAISDKVSSCDHEEWVSLAIRSSECLSKDPECPVDMLEWFMLQKYHLKQPFTREEMVALVSEQYRQEFPEIFKSACDHLEAIFAVELREVGFRRHTYKLFSMLSLPNNGRVRPGRGYPKTGLLMKILVFILMKGHHASEDDIWKFLKRMKVYPGKKHIMFGEPTRLVTQDFVRLKYLEYRQVPGSVPPCHEFMWGPEANAESSKEKIMKFFIRINNNCPTSLCLYEDFGRMEIEKFQASLSTKHVSTGKPLAVEPAMYPAAPVMPAED